MTEEETFYAHERRVHICFRNMNSFVHFYFLRRAEDIEVPAYHFYVLLHAKEIMTKYDMYIGKGERERQYDVDSDYATSLVNIRCH